MKCWCCGAGIGIFGWIGRPPRYCWECRTGKCNKCAVGPIEDRAPAVLRPDSRGVHADLQRARADRLEFDLHKAEARVRELEAERDTPPHGFCTCELCKPYARLAAIQASHDRLVALARARHIEWHEWDLNDTARSCGNPSCPFYGALAAAEPLVASAEPKIKATECPGPDCPACSGEACALCGAGTRPVENVCEHDVIQRHTEPKEADRG